MLKGKTYEVYYKNDLAFSINSGGKVVINNNTDKSEIVNLRTKK